VRPDGLELVRAVRALLEQVLPETAAPFRRAQLVLAARMLDAAIAELDDAPAAFAEERARMRALAREAAPLLRGHADAVLLADLESLATVSAEPRDLRLSAQAAESVRWLAVLDALAARCAAPDAAPELAALGTRMTAELRARAERRASWGLLEPK
jgi:hypothetical protein